MHTTIDLEGAPEGWSRLGHDFRVVVHVTVWRSDSVLAIPIAALFRKDDDWAVYAVRGGRARTARVQVGHRNNRQAEIMSGLSAGDVLIVHPSDRVTEGARVASRGSE